jgi:hypothetical protein
MYAPRRSRRAGVVAESRRVGVGAAGADANAVRLARRSLLGRDRESCAFARLFSIGSALSFEARGVRPEVSHLTSFYAYSLGRGIPQALRTQAWPRITRFDDRWRWIVTSIVPRFQRFEADTRLVDASLRRIFDEVRDYASNPCVLPHEPPRAR